MCYEFELEYQLRRAEQARKELKKAEERSGTPASPKPLAPAAAPAPQGQEDPVPV